MKNEQIKEQIIKLIVFDLLQDEEKMGELDGNSKFFEEIEMDSISVVNLLVLIEENYGIEIKDVTEFTDSLKDINSLVEYICNKTNK